ncbi:MAG: hypothetical protein IJP31_11140 [Lachnospiraceae bacterium]|nr:hypothetical protein [Lachnospiraceae bacterium]
MRHFHVGNMLPMGATPVGTNAVQFVCQNTGRKNAGLVLYEKKTGKREEIPFTDNYQIGNVYSLVIEGINPEKYTYNFIQDGKEEVDPYAGLIAGNEKWGQMDVRLSGRIGLSDFEWEGDEPLRRSFSDCIFYQLHVRGFTRHSSSKVRKKGTFEGIIEKIPYLKELGVNTLELLPAYEFMEQEAFVDVPEREVTMEFARANYHLKPSEEGRPRLNYWGFKPGAYFAPKASYSAGNKPDISFKGLVKHLHHGGIELVMQFYFEPAMSPVYLLEILRYWVREYHVDGFRLLGAGLPIEFLAADPILCNTKLMYESFEEGRVYDSKYFPVYRNIADYNDGYLYALRHFIKGDVGSLGRAFEAMLHDEKKIGNMVYVTNYNSFTLRDMVSYDRKHNEENGEEGRDGNNYNVSWNCGTEGASKRKAIVALREKQMKNALTLLLFSKGTPVLLAGDEFGNTQGGNNNPYCQDNVVSWLNWKDLEKNNDFFHFVKEVISLRKQFPLLLKQADTGTKRTGVEYPYLSYHGKEAWKLIWNEGNEEAGGILFYSEQIYLYLCVNMHWQGTVLALPNLPGKQPWELLLDTSGEKKKGELWQGKSIAMGPRSVKLITAKGKKGDFEEGLSAF